MKKKISHFFLSLPSHKPDTLVPKLFIIRLNSDKKPRNIYRQISWLLDDFNTFGVIKFQSSLWTYWYNFSNQFAIIVEIWFKKLQIQLFLKIYSTKSDWHIFTLPNLLLRYFVHVHCSFQLQYKLFSNPGKSVYWDNKRSDNNVVLGFDNDVKHWRCFVKFVSLVSLLYNIKPTVPFV